MQKSEQAQTVCRTVAETMAGMDGIKVVIVYGSAATGNMRTGSDVDVAVLFDKPLDMEMRLAVWNRLTDALKCEVDVVDLYGLGGEILHQILTKGRVVIKNDVQAFFRILQRMVYNEEDFMPQVRKVLEARIRRFAYG